MSSGCTRSFFHRPIIVFGFTARTTSSKLSTGCISRAKTAFCGVTPPLGRFCQQQSLLSSQCYISCPGKLQPRTVLLHLFWALSPAYQTRGKREDALTIPCCDLQGRIQTGYVRDLHCGWVKQGPPTARGVWGHAPPGNFETQVANDVFFCDFGLKLGKFSCLNWTRFLVILSGNLER